MDQAYPLADTDQLAAFLDDDVDVGTASLYLDIASGMVRDYLHQQVTYVENDVVVLDPAENATVSLPELPITAVTLVEILDPVLGWTACAAGTWTASLNTGLVLGLAHHGVWWPLLPGSWRVTYTHGFLTPPSSLVGVVLGVAARAYTSPVGVQQERVGSYQVRYAVEAAGFSPLELTALARYKVPRVA